MAFYFIGKQAVALAQGRAVGRRRGRSSIIFEHVVVVGTRRIASGCCTPCRHQSRHIHGDHGGSCD